jgi:hypothetical protein
MRFALAIAVVLTAAPAAAETWFVREGECSEWQSVWNVTQQETGFWVGEAEHVHVGGPCERATGNVLRSGIRATITGDTLFAVRQTGDTICTHVAQIRSDRGRGFALCERAERTFFSIRFRAPERRSARGMQPDDELLDNEQGQPGGRRFRERGLEDWFDRR